MKRIARSEYIIGIILILIVVFYGIYARLDIRETLSLIIGSMFASKGLTDFGKNKG